MKKIGLAILGILAFVGLAGCENNGREIRTLDVAVLEARENIRLELSNRPDVTDEDMIGIPEGALIIPLVEIENHSIAENFDHDGWFLCNLTGDCTLNVRVPGLNHGLDGDIFTFSFDPEAREMTLPIDGNAHRCYTNENNNLLICEDLGFVLEGMMASTNLDNYIDESVRLTDTTTFEITHTDGITDSSTVAGTRADLIDFLESESNSFSINIVHDKVGSELIATHIQILVFS